VSVKLGTAPDSWGIWFPDDPKQLPGNVFRDEVVEAGYSIIELGPFGYLPTEPNRLSEELEERGLVLSGGFAMPDLHRKDTWGNTQREVERVCELLKTQGAEFLVLIPNVYTNLFSGEQTWSPHLDEAEWRTLIETTHRAADFARAEWDINVVFHPHAETHVEYAAQVERFLEDTDPDLIALCLDIGHYEYRDGVVERFLVDHHGRVDYIHLKSVDAEVKQKVNVEGIPFARAVDLGMFVEPELGSIDFERVAGILDEANFNGFGIVEQDLYPTEPSTPLPIAKRTRSYMESIGFGVPNGD